MTLWNEQSSPRLAFFRRWWGWIVTLGAALMVAVLMVAWEKPATEPLADTEPGSAAPAPAAALAQTEAPQPAPTTDEMKTPPPEEAPVAEAPDTHAAVILTEPESIDALNEKINALEKRVSQLESREESSHTNSLFGEIYKLRLRFEHGERADDVLLQIMNQPLSDEQQAWVKTLISLDQNGIDSLQKLTAQFSDLADRFPASTDTAGNVFDRAENWAKAHIVIRKVGEAHTGNDDESVIARAEADLRNNDVALALNEMAGLSTPAQHFFAAWRERAERRLNAIKTLEEFEHSVSGPANQP